MKDLSSGGYIKASPSDAYTLSLSPQILSERSRTPSDDRWSVPLVETFTCMRGSFVNLGNGFQHEQRDGKWRTTLCDSVAP